MPVKIEIYIDTELVGHGNFEVAPRKGDRIDTSEGDTFQVESVRHKGNAAGNFNYQVAVSKK